MKRHALIVALLAAGTLPTFAQDVPPSLLDYRGVLRNAAGAPEAGPRDMVFRFFDGAGSAQPILVDSHTAASGGAVPVQGGLFKVQLGAGAVSDGSGPGIYTSLAQVFRDYSSVYLEVQVGLETLTPRARIVAAGYALNAGHIEGHSTSWLLDRTAAAQTKSGALVLNSSAPGYGLEARGPTGGGSCLDNNGTGRAYLAYGDYGLRASGGVSGGYFEDSSTGDFAYAGYGDFGLWGRGFAAGGYFKDLDNTGTAYAGRGDRGVEGYGSDEGGYFEDLESSSFARLGNGDYGMDARGYAAGGRFVDEDSSGYAEVGSGDFGIGAYGSTAGGYFADADSSSQAYVGYGSEGIAAYGTTAGGAFYDTDESGRANVGYGNYGLQGFGTSAGGSFQDRDASGRCELATDYHGLYCEGETAGGYFNDRDNSGHAYVGKGSWGIQAYGDAGGGYFDDTDTSSYADVAYDTYKIRGSGTLSFVQNHPLEPDKVIVYAAPEMDEVMVYTRGTARLVGGQARVALGETFALVANPDIGLTAYLTPRDAAVPLAVIAVTPHELVVRGPAGWSSPVAFDYVVSGLRIGFEDVSIVQEKQQESFIPSMEEHRRSYERFPELRRYNALERFRAMMATTRRTGATIDLGAAPALRAQIGEYDPQIHGPVEQLLGHGVPATVDGAGVGAEPEARAPVREDTTQDAGVDAGTGRRDDGAITLVRRLVPPAGGPAPRPAARIAVSEPVEPGDVLVLDAQRTGVAKLGILSADPTILGVVIEADSKESLAPGQAPVAFTGIVPCKVDAAYGAIRVGDLLNGSATPGHAGRAQVNSPGTILGKALEPLEAGTGSIRVLLLLR